MSSIVCALLSRFELVVACGERESLLSGPVALAPEPGREQAIGQVSRAAEAFGLHAGMRLGEALARCPRLVLVAPDPIAAAELWELTLARLEAIGAAVESTRLGVACFDARGLLRLHGSLGGVLAATRAAIGRPVRLGVGPSRFCAIVAATTRARVRRAGRIEGAADLADESIALLRQREQTAALSEPLERLGVHTLGQLAALPRSAVADRFGRAGLLAHDLACGRDLPLRPRRPGETLSERLDLEESASGQQLERALALLVDRLIARSEREGRTLRVVVLGASLVEGGTWRERVVFREPLSDPGRIRIALGQRLSLLPAPAERLQLVVERFGPPHPVADGLFEDGSKRRRERLREAVRQARAVAGPEAALRVLEVDPDSRVPERRVVLTPFDP